MVIRHQVWEAVRHSLKVEGWLEAEGREESLDRVVRVWRQAQIHQALGAELEVLPEQLRQVIGLQVVGLYGATPSEFRTDRASMGVVSGTDPPTAQEEALSLLRLPALSIHLRSLCERTERGPRLSGNASARLRPSGIRQRAQRGRR